MERITYFKNKLAEAKSLAIENPNKSITMAKQIFEEAEKGNYIAEMGYSYFTMAYAYRVMSDYSASMEYAFKAKDIFNDIGDLKGVINAYNIIGIIHFYYGDFTTALEYFNKSLEMVDDVDDYNRKSAILNNIGEIYREAGENDKALKYYMEALNICLKYSLDMNTATAYINIGEVYHQMNDDYTAMEYFNKAYALSKCHSNSVIKGEVDTKLGRYFLIKGDLEQAEFYFLSGLSYLNKVKNKFYMIDLLINLAELDEAKGNSPMNYAIEALNIAIEHKLEVKISTIYKIIASYQEKIGEYKQAYMYYKAYHSKEKEVEAGNLAKRLEIISSELTYHREINSNDNFKRISEKLERDINMINQELSTLKAKNTLLENENLMDELTRVYNRRGINQQMMRYAEVDDGKMDAVFLVDIDYFKRYNDYWGHLQGDVCLKKIVTALKCRESDCFIGRFGGEEFLCYYRVENREEAKRIGEMIRTATEALKLSYSDLEDNYITVSIGGNVGALRSNHYIEFIDEADRALYKAKEGGRNRVVIASTGV